MRLDSDGVLCCMLEFYSLKICKTPIDILIIMTTTYKANYNVDTSYEEKHCSRSWTKTSTAQNLGCRKARLGRKERLSCASFRPRTASCASLRIGLSCAFLRTGRRYIVGLVEDGTNSESGWRRYQFRESKMQKIYNPVIPIKHISHNIKNVFFLLDLTS